MANNNQPSPEHENFLAEKQEINNRSGGVYFGDQAIVQGDVIGGNKYEVRFYALSSKRLFEKSERW